MGQGPRTGRGLGRCNPNERAEENPVGPSTANEDRGYGPGRGPGRGQGRGRGRGMGRGGGQGRGFGRGRG